MSPSSRLTGVPGPILPSLRGSEAPGRFGALGIVYIDAATIPGAQDQLVDSVARRPILTPAPSTKPFLLCETSSAFGFVSAYLAAPVEVGVVF